MKEALSDETLAVRVQLGNQTAFTQLYTRYQEKMVRYGRRFLYTHEDAEDATQEVFIKAYSNIKSYDASRAFSTWLYRIAHNTFIDVIRKKGREPLSILDLDTFLALPMQEKSEMGERVMTKIDLAHAEKRIARLPVKYREVFILYHYEEKNYQEIAEILHIPVSTVGVRLSRGRALLKKLVNLKISEPL